MGEIRALQLEILAEVDRYCREHRVTYYLAFGTLLGAVRHGGYIPWDDDIDVMMPRADYRRFVADFDRATEVAHLSVVHPGNRPGWPLPYAKVSDERTALVEPLEAPVSMGVNIDVFPIDPVPSGRIFRRVSGALLSGLLWALELKYIAAERGRGWHHPLTLLIGKRLLRPISLDRLVALCTLVAEYGARPGSARDGGEFSVLVGSVRWSAPEASLSPPSELAFEGLMCQAPQDPDRVLHEVYGDYRELPAPEDRVSDHSFTAHWRDES